MTRPESPGAARPARTTASAAFAAEGFTTEEAARIHADIVAYNRRESRGFIAELRAMGFRLLPLPANKKKPPPTGYPTNGVDYIIPDGANVAIDTGHFVGGGALLVVDVDCKSGKPGEQSLAHLEEKHGKLPPTLTTVTPTGGRHLFFRVPRPVAPSVSKIGEALDVRSRGGYVVAPGSKVPAGLYRFAGQENAPAGSVVSAGTHPPIAQAPAWLPHRPGYRAARLGAIPRASPTNARRRRAASILGGNHCAAAIGANQDRGIPQRPAEAVHKVRAGRAGLRGFCASLELAQTSALAAHLRAPVRWGVWGKGARTTGAHLGLTTWAR